SHRFTLSIPLREGFLFLGFRIVAIRRRDFAVFPVQSQRRLRRLKRYFGDQMSVGAQMVVVLKTFVKRRMPLVLGHPFEFSWFDVSQTDVFHPILLVCAVKDPGEPRVVSQPALKSASDRRVLCDTMIARLARFLIKLTRYLVSCDS